MRAPAGKRVYLLIAIVALVATLVAYVFLFDGRVLGLSVGPPPALSESTTRVELRVDVTLPDRLTDAQQSFLAEGIVDYPSDRAQMIYDFEGLANAAGFFGHLERFLVYFSDDGIYAEIFLEEPSFILMEPTELVGLRIERLREVAMSSPLILPLLLDELSSGSSHAEPVGSRIELDDLRTDEEAEQQALELLEELGVRSIVVAVEREGGFPTQVDQELRFPVTEGARDDVIVRIEARTSLTSARDITLPEEDQYKTLSDFLSGD